MVGLSNGWEKKSNSTCKLNQKKGLGKREGGVEGHSPVTGGGDVNGRDLSGRGRQQPWKFKGGGGREFHRNVCEGI